MRITSGRVCKNNCGDLSSICKVSHFSLLVTIRSRNGSFLLRKRRSEDSSKLRLFWLSRNSFLFVELFGFLEFLQNLLLVQAVFKFVRKVVNIIENKTVKNENLFENMLF